MVKKMMVCYKMNFKKIFDGKGTFKFKDGDNICINSIFFKGK